MLRDFKPRLYQETIFATTVSNNTLVVLPTGMGKTAIAVMLGAARLAQYPTSKVLVLAPTRPLVQQHKKSFEQLLSEEHHMEVFTGLIRPEKRKELWNKATLIFSTPQGLENDIINKNISLADVSLIVFDEAHRAVGEYSYNFIAAQYMKHAQYPRVLGLTASPGSDKETIQEVIQNLHIEKVEVRTEEDPDVREYIQEVNLQWIHVELPQNYQTARRFLQDCYFSKLDQLKTKGLIYGSIGSYNKSSILALQASIQVKLSKGEKDYELLKAMSLVAEAMKVQHALELIETQGVKALIEYMNKLEQQSRTTKVKAVQNLVNDLNYKSARIVAEKILTEGEEHPKLYKLIELVKREVDNNIKIIVFNQYRDQAEVIKEALDNEGITSKIFVGQQKKKNTGLSQKEQQKVLEEFSNNEFTCLIATSVAEEGLDIPKVDVVIFFEPVPSAIRSIQRRGRTGRLEKGKVYVLVTKGTRDEGYKWVSQNKEKRMFNTLRSLRGQPVISQPREQKLTNYVQEDRVKIITDFREKNSLLLKQLIDEGAEVQLQRLEVGDYLLSDKVCVEIKRVPDFVDSIIDGRLLGQLRDLKQYGQAILMIEGEEDIYSMRRVHPNAIRGMLSTIILSYGIPTVQTKNARETAAMLLTMAKQIQSPDQKYTFHKSKPLTIRDQQEFLISTLPGIGPVISKPLLRKFKKPKNIFNATEEELKEVELVGPTKAQNIRRVLDSEYD